jgi:hypothetical protein
MLSGKLPKNCGPASIVSTQWTARRGAQELLDAYRRIGITKGEFEGEQYKRIAHLQRLMADGYIADDLRPAKPLHRVPETVAELGVN